MKRTWTTMNGKGAELVRVNTERDYRNIPRKRRRQTGPSLYKPLPLTLQNNQLTTDMKITLYHGPVAVDDAGVIESLTQNISRGDNVVDNFNGGKINPTGLKFRWSALVTSGTAKSTCTMRLIIFQWFDAAVPVPLSVLYATDPLSPISWDNRPNIRVLYDQVIQGNNPSTYSNYLLMDPRGKNNVYVKGKKIAPIEFPRNTVLPQKGGLYMMALSDDPAGVSSTTLAVYSEIDFLD